MKPHFVDYACGLMICFGIFMPTDTEHTVSIYPMYHEKMLPFIEGCAQTAAN